MSSIQTDKFTVCNGFHSFVELICLTCLNTDWNNRCVASWDGESETEAMNLASVVSMAQAHWAQVHAVPE